MNKPNRPLNAPRLKSQTFKQYMDEEVAVFPFDGGMTRFTALRIQQAAKDFRASCRHTTVKK